MDTTYTYDESGRAILKKGRYSGIRKIIGTNMVNSLKKSPQATITMRVDMSGMKALKDRLREQGIKVTYTDIYIKAVACALLKHPAVNAAVIDEKFLYQYANANIGVAVGTDHGLYVPVIKDAQDKSISQISAELKEMAANIRGGTVLPEYFSGGTFTISNLGMYDMDVMTPIINMPEAGILCLGVIRKEQVVQEDDTVAIKPMMAWSLSLDHAAMDGVDGAKFLMTLRDIISAPEKYVLD